MIDRMLLTGLQLEAVVLRALFWIHRRGRPRRAPPAAGSPLRVLQLAHYPGSNAGTRCRLRKWGERLAAAGHRVDLLLPVPGENGEELFSSPDRWDRAAYLRAMLGGRCRALALAPVVDVVVIHLSDLPQWEYGPPWVLAALRRIAGRVLVDLDDLPVIRGESEPRPRMRRMVELADGLIAGNTEIPRHFPAGPWWHVPTCVDPADWDVPDRSARDGPVQLGWVGTRGNMRYLEALAPVLADVCTRTGAQLRVISSDPPDLPGVPVTFVPWSAERESEHLAAIDVGLAPLDDGPMERCKCGLKALQYMASGVPVVASPVGVLGEIVRHGETGYLAADAAQWGGRLTQLVGDREARLAAGEAGRRAAAQSWSFDAHEKRYLDALTAEAPSGR